ncbi:hypothetical protein PGTUg99_017162 [Puccinia graminis f. sp. tritici]|uniref:Retrotransposon gag domain-containing protein n=1 Tax=Puccinia graminis f. sp. tritici TaxID=56615 RepID=A0A5B0LUW2_PUCGR|nr:hypothetical protein PGTUg99_025173 [Puccinia graminis f. sp. tritici]KAA1135988.1 hypothetical protein PGTUg99_017162 [Puccinia graminis f. sp. tritici]
MSDTTTTPAGQEQTTKSNWTLADTSKLITAKEWSKAVLKIQHTSIVQAQEDCHQVLEDLQVHQAAFQEAQKANSDRISCLEDLLPTDHENQKQETESFLCWIHAQTNLQSFNANKATGFLGKSWEEFKKCLFELFLPDYWCSGLKQQIQQLEMTTLELFLEYSTRA